MKKLIALIGLVGLLLSSPAYSGTLVLSPQLKIEYEAPEYVAHDGNILYLRYKDWFLAHERLRPNGGLYSMMNLTGIEGDFVKSIFDTNERAKLTEWLAVLARQQAEVIGADHKENVDKEEVGDAEIYGVYNPREGMGVIYVFDKKIIHVLTVQGTKNKYSTVLTNIEVR